MTQWLWVLIFNGGHYMPPCTPPLGYSNLFGNRKLGLGLNVFPSKDQTNFEPPFTTELSL